MTFKITTARICRRGRNRDSLRATRSGDRIPVEVIVSATVQTDPGAQPASCTTGTRSPSLVQSGQNVVMTTHPYLGPRLQRD